MMTNKEKDIELYNDDCITIMGKFEDDSVDLVLTDIPYGEVNRGNSGLSQMKNSDKGKADILTFNLEKFCDEVYRLTKSTAIIFCGNGQFSTIFNYFANKKGTVRQLIWEKTNPVPSNGKHIYLSGIENAVWFKKHGGTFNAFCKNTVFRYPIQSNQIHPTEKNHKLLEELILDNSNEGDLVLDTCMGSGSTGIACLNTGRNFVGIELCEEFYNKAKDRLYTTKEKLKFKKSDLLGDP